MDNDNRPDDDAVDGTSAGRRRGVPPVPKDYLILIEFVYKHLDFQLAELRSMLEMHGITLGSAQCQVVPLPFPATEEAEEEQEEEEEDQQQQQKIQQQQETQHQTRRRRRQRPEPKHRAFTILAFPWNDAPRLSGLEQQQQKEDQQGREQQFDPKIPSKEETAARSPGLSIADILHKCTLVRSVVELWGYSSSNVQDCADQTYRWLSSGNDDDDDRHDDDGGSSSSYRRTMVFPHVQDRSWRLHVHTVGMKLSLPEQASIRSTFDRTVQLLRGPVDLSHPQTDLLFIREIELDDNGSPALTDDGRGGMVEECTDAIACYFGRVLGGVRHKGRARPGLERYSLKNRPYLGPTSMDAELSFVMTTLGLVRTGSIVLDPFVGTGSILLSCSMRGAYCVGTDIDIRVIRGKGGNQTIWNNFEYYGLPRPDIVRSDNALYQRHFRHHHRPRRQDTLARTTTTTTTTTPTTIGFTEPLYDAIVTDPPYGIRAGARTSGSKRRGGDDGSDRTVISEEHRWDHIAQTRAYPVSDVMSDLVDVAAQTLVLKGRLVYIIPSFQDFDPETDLPRHDCLRLIHSCYQPLGLELGRRIVVMEKVQDYDVSRRDTYRASIWKYGAESASKCSNLRERILERARSKPGYEEKAAVRKEKRKANKVARKEEKKKKMRQRLGTDNDHDG
jgi:tRNA (guanine10-N2)-methyltransferase